jgi:hypothetical protein
VKPEEKARQKIDQLLIDADWTIQDYNNPKLNLKNLEKGCHDQETSKGI